MTELHQTVSWTEKYRPQSFEDLVMSDDKKKVIQSNVDGKLRSMIFYSSRPGTGKTSTAKVIANYLDCDLLAINSSDERGIDVIRDKIKSFAKSMASNGKKKLVFLDEADGLTKIAQDSLRNLMETYEGNCFFIFTCNDVSKIIEPIYSRCKGNVIAFENPPKSKVKERLEFICKEEDVDTSGINVDLLVDIHYPDMRGAIHDLETFKDTGVASASGNEAFVKFFDLIVKKDFQSIYSEVYSGTLNILAFNKWLFHFLFENVDKYDQFVLAEITLKLADTEKYHAIGCNLEVIFISNILEISRSI